MQSQLERLVEKNYYLHQSARDAYRCVRACGCCVCTGVTLWLLLILLPAAPSHTTHSQPLTDSTPHTCYHMLS